jgi:hypothetical protein
MIVSELFWEASVEELKKGFIQDEDHYVCLFCEEKFEKGIIYPEEGVFYEAGRYMRLHIEKAHQSVFASLVSMDKDLTGLSEHQKKLLQFFYQGKSDKEIQEEMGIGSASTIRNHRFALKKKERQAKLLVTLMELVKQNDQHMSAVSNGNEKAVDEDEYEKIVRKNFPGGLRGPLKTFRLTEKHKLIVLQEIAKHFEQEKVYTENEVNEILKLIFPDYVLIRRNLVEYGFLDRKLDGSQYWVKNRVEKEGEDKVEQRKEIKRLYKETKPEAGVYQIKNMKNQKVFVASSSNLKTINGKRFQLKTGAHKNQALQKDWNEFGEDAFEFEVLEILKPKDNAHFDTNEELEKLEKKWLEKLQPFGEQGYNQKK